MYLKCLVLIFSIFYIVKNTYISVSQKESTFTVKEESREFSNRSDPCSLPDILTVNESSLIKLFLFSPEHPQGFWQIDDKTLFLNSQSEYYKILQNPSFEDGNEEQQFMQKFIFKIEDKSIDYRLRYYNFIKSSYSEFSYCLRIDVNNKVIEKSKVINKSKNKKLNNEM